MEVKGSLYKQGISNPTAKDQNQEVDNNKDNNRQARGEEEKAIIHVRNTSFHHVNHQASVKKEKKKKEKRH